VSPGRFDKGEASRNGGTRGPGQTRRSLMAGRFVPAGDSPA